MPRHLVALISTGGTIEKTYDERSGMLANGASVLDLMLNSLQLEGVELDRVRLLNKDSLHLTESDHDLILDEVRARCADHDGVVVVHGTDRLPATGERLHAALGSPAVPVILTGAMRPYEMRHTDAVQNLVEALLAVQILPGGVYVCMHNQVLSFPGVVKDLAAGTFRES